MDEKTFTELDENNVSDSHNLVDEENSILARVTIKNRNLLVPSFIIHDELKECWEVKSISIDYKAGANELKFWLEFEGRMFIQINDMENFSTFLRINYENKSYWIFFPAFEDLYHPPTIIQKLGESLLFGLIKETNSWYVNVDINGRWAGNQDMIPL